MCDQFCTSKGSQHTPTKEFATDSVHPPLNRVKGYPKIPNQQYYVYHVIHFHTVTYITIYGEYSSAGQYIEI